MPLGHLGINVPDLAAARVHYDAVLPLLGYEPFFARDDELACRSVAGKVGTYLFLYPSTEPSDYSLAHTGLQHLAFIVPTRPDVMVVIERVRSLGCEVVHEPREWPEYGDRHFAGFWIDPFGFMFEAVCHASS